MVAYNGYSSNVSLSLVVGGTTLSLTHVGPKSFIVRDECEPIPEGYGELVIKVDQSQQTYNVFLPHGVPGAGQPVGYL
jgi:hypothetical protein